MTLWVTSWHLHNIIYNCIMDFWWCLPWVPKPGRISHLHTLLPVCNAFLRFTSGAKPDDLLMASIVAELFLIHVLVHIHSSIGGARVQHQACYCFTVCDRTKWAMNSALKPTLCTAVKLAAPMTPRTSSWNLVECSTKKFLETVDKNH